MSSKFLSTDELGGFISIPLQIVYGIREDKTVIPAYIYLGMNVNRFGVVSFLLSDYYSFMGEKGRKTTDKRRNEYRIGLQKMIDKFRKSDYKFYFNEENIDFDKIRSGNRIIFGVEDQYLKFASNQRGYVPIDISIVAIIQNYYKNRRQNLFGKTLSLYVYLMMCMSYPKTKNDDGSYHYSNNPVYYTCFKKKLMESVNMTETELDTGIKHLVDMNLIKTYYPGSYNGIAKISGGVDLNISVFGLPTVYVPILCPQVRNFDCDDNFNEALKKICKDNGYSFKRYTQKLREQS